MSAIVAGLGTAAASAGLLVEDLYRDNDFVRAAWQGSDWVTLALAVPLLLVSLNGKRQHSIRAQLLGCAALAYMVYGYAYYLFGARFNALFLVYVAIVAVSMLALVFALIALNAADLVAPPIRAPATRWVAGYMMFVAAGLTVVYVAQSMAAISTGHPPPIVTITEHPTSVVFAIDLTLLVPWQLVAAIWLWNGRRWGYLLATILNTKGAVYTLGLTLSSLLAARAGIPEATSEVPLWVGLTVANAAAAAWLWTHPPIAGR